MSTPNGYNNPAYCHQYDSSLYDYQYVPEIDPDYPDLDDESNRHQTKLIHPNYRRKFTSESEETTGSDENVGSDESGNGSIIIEECNNRRVTMICEKRRNEEYDERYSGTTYYQDVSLESENGNDDQSSKQYVGGEARSRDIHLHLQKQIEPKIDREHQEYLIASNNAEKKHYYQRSQSQHRYEEIPGNEDEFCSDPSTVFSSVHRYAEITSDENGFPTLKKPIEIKKANLGALFGQSSQSKPIRVVSKPRATTPPNGFMSFSSPSTPSRMNSRNPYNKPLIFRSESPSQPFSSMSPVRTNSFEMAELSPPRSLDPVTQRSVNDQTYFMSSPKRQPPIGASPANECADPLVSTPNRCILPTHLQKHSSKSKSAPNSPKRHRELLHLTYSTPSKSPFDRKVMQIFNVKSDRVKSKTTFRNVGDNSVRRNISNSFTDSPANLATPKRKPNIEPLTGTLNRTPYKSTTTEIVQPKTAVITPIFQRKNQQVQSERTPSRRDFAKMSQAFQSTGNLFKQKDCIYPNTERLDYRADTMGTRLKRNQSVPNFAQSFKIDNRLSPRKPIDVSYLREDQKLPGGLQYSPVKKAVENLSPINKSRLSLIDQSRSSWSNTGSDYYPRCSTCFIFATIIHLVTATATCAISFYLLSKMGRRYYLDFGIIAGFINFTLGLLGFRSYCWRWLPNRNYVSGFIGLAAFSAFTCAALSYLIVVRPMAGDPVLDIMGGAIGAVSVLTILLALTGLTMSSCCKAPPPDNRVADV